jgi:hypothetical protein
VHGAGFAVLAAGDRLIFRLKTAIQVVSELIILEEVAVGLQCSFHTIL